MKEKVSNQMKKISESNNKRYRILSMILALVLILSCLTPAFEITTSASDTVQTADIEASSIAESVTETAEEDEDSVLASSEEEIIATSESDATSVAEEEVAADISSTDDAETVSENAVEEEKETVLVLRDKKTGVTVSISESAMPEDIERKNIGLTVSELTKKETKEALEITEVEEDLLVRALDISLIDKTTEKEIQPTGEVTVTITKTDDADELEGSVEVRRINDDNTVTELGSVGVTEDDFVFDTEHFTVYVLSNNHTGTEQAASFEILKQIIEKSGDTDIEIELKDDIQWPDTNGTGNAIIRIPSGKKVTIRSTQDGRTESQWTSRKRLTRSENTRGTMFWVDDGAELTLRDVTMDGAGGQYFGNGDEGWNGVPSYVKGVFIYSQGKVNLEYGADLANAHTTVDYNYVGGSQNTTADLTKFSAPIFLQGGELNMEDGSSIYNSEFVGRVKNGGSYYSAGAVVAAPSRDGTKKSVFNMNGGHIYSNKVGWNQSKSDKQILRDYGDNLYSVRTSDTGAVPDTGVMHPSLVDGQVMNSQSIWPNRAGESAMTEYPGAGGVEKRTPGSGAVLLLGSDMNMSGGTIEWNNGETGAIAINGVSPMFYDLFTDANRVTDNYEELVKWNEGGSGNNDTGVGINADAVNRLDLHSTLNLTGGNINANTGLTNGAIYVGRYGKLIMGEEDKINENNDNIKIVHNRTINDWGGTIGLVNAQETSTGRWSDPQNIDGTGVEPELHMYSGTVAENHSVMKGGGFEIATDSAYFYGGVIKDNVADHMGGGIYAEMGYEVVFKTIVEVANNRATTEYAGSSAVDDQAYLNGLSDAQKTEERLLNGKAWGWENDNSYNVNMGFGSGGGIWLCPEGQSVFDVSMLLIHDNTADVAGDDLFKVVTPRYPNTGLLYLPLVDPAGGGISWYRDGGFTKDDGYVTNATTNLVPRYENDGSLTPIAGGESDVYERYDDYTGDLSEIEVTGQTNRYDSIAVKAEHNRETLADAQSYAKLTITGNSSIRGGGIGSDARLRFGGDTTEVRTHKLAVSKKWDGGAVSQRISVALYGKISDTERRFIRRVSLNANNGYSNAFEGLGTTMPTGTGENDYIVLFEEVNGEWQPTENLILVEEIDGYDSSTIPYTMSQNVKFDRITYEDIVELNDENPNGTYAVRRPIHNYTIELTNTPKDTTDTYIKKTNLGGQWLNGAKLRIINGDTVTDDAQIMYEWVTSDENRDQAFKLMEGTYTLVELESPDGYEIADPIVFKVENDKVYVRDANGTFVEQSDNTVTMIDGDYVRRIIVKKTWEVGTTPQEIEVQLYENGSAVTASYGKVKLNADNEWTYTWVDGKDGVTLLENATYTVREITVSNDFYPVYNSIADDWVKVDELHEGAQIIISRNDADGAVHPLLVPAETATYDYVSSRGEVFVDSEGRFVSPTQDIIWTVVKNDNGTFSLVNEATGKKLTSSNSYDTLRMKDLDYTPDHAGGDEFSFDENGTMFISGDTEIKFAIKSPYGEFFHSSYNDAEVDRYVTFTLYERTTATPTTPRIGETYVYLQNKSGEQQTGELKLVKAAADDTTIALEGAKFELRDSDGVLIATMVTDANGIINFGDLEYGTYTLKETEAPGDYELDSTEIEIEINAKGAFINGVPANATILKNEIGNSVTVDNGNARYYMTSDRSVVRSIQNDSINALWALCMNENRQEPTTAVGGQYVKFTNVNYSTMKTLVDRRSFSSDDYIKIRRALYYFLMNYEGDPNAETDALKALGEVIRLYTDDVQPEYENSTVAGYGQEFINAAESAANDETINKNLNVIVYADQGRSDDQLEGSDASIKKLQNMIYAELIFDGGGTNVFDTVRVTNETTPSYDLPLTGGMGTRMIIMTGLALVAAAGAGYVLFGRKRKVTK